MSYLSKAKIEKYIEGRPQYANILKQLFSNTIYVSKENILRQFRMAICHW